MKHKYYILTPDHKIKVVNTVEEWAEQFENESRTVCRTAVGDYTVSTVFLGIDHNYHSDGPPILFECMIFKTMEADPGKRWEGKYEDFQERYATYKEAMARHKDIILRLKAGYPLYDIDTDEQEIPARETDRR